MGAPGTQDRRILLQFNLWSLGVLALQCALNAAWLSTRLPDSKILPSVFDQLLASSGALADAAWFAGASIALHAALACAWYAVWRPLDARWLARVRAERAPLANLSFLLVLLGVMLANASLFPRSAFASHGAMTGAAWLGGAALVACVAVAAAVAASLFARGRWWALAAAGVVAVAVAVGVEPAAPWRAAAPSSERARPDVILIGIDSLRVDHVGAALTPAIAGILEGATVLEDAWTPLGRTVPAWVSVLTGRYPPSHGADFNLTPREHVDARDSLAHALGGLGYERLYAIDETRFSNLDRSFGFDHMVAPAIGAFDFLAGAFGDLPLVNLVTATRAGALLFPYLHMNRGHALAYRPRVFDDALARAVADLDAGRPLFLVAHFELPHWPYHWADATPATARANAHDATPDAYQRAVAAADGQVGALLAALGRAGRLDNAIVVVLSDHGESFHQSERAWPGMVTAAGHGTSALSASQNHVLLAFRGYGPQAAVSPPGRRTGTASLVDVRATLQDWLDLPAPARALEGASWLAHDGGMRVVTVETGFSPAEVVAGDPDAFVVAGQGAQYYRIREDGRASLRADWIARLRAQKQRAAIAGDWVLAALPDRGAGARLLLLDAAGGTITDLRGGTPLPAAAPVAALLEALCARYRSDAGFELAECE